ncbi:MAG: T9SS type A sorting domain-containing protein [Bacteroidota bacterium]
MFRNTILTLLLFVGSSLSAQVIPNGDFTGPSTTTYNGWAPPGWSTTVQSPDTWAAGPGPDGFNAPASPNGGTFVRTNGFGPEGFQAFVTGLTVGQPFTIDFYFGEACINLNPSPGTGGYVFNMFGVNQLTPVVICSTPAIWVPGSVTFIPTSTAGMLTITTQALGGHSHTILDGLRVGVVLPIEGVEFRAWARRDRTVGLDWTAEREVDTDFYLVERSEDGMTWEFLEQMDATGNVQDPTWYQTEDLNPYFGRSYYRLKSFGLDGHAEYSEVQTVDFEVPTVGELLLYPNPTEGKVTLAGSAQELTVVRVFDVLGQEVTPRVTQQLMDETHLELDLGALSAGIYLVKTAMSAKRVQVR